MLNKHKLETILIKNWTELFDIREILKYVQSISSHLPSNKTNVQINNLGITRFELNPQGFIIWLNYNVIENQIKYKSTSEVLLDFNGNLNHIQTTRD